MDSSDTSEWLNAVAAALEDADAQLVTDLGGSREVTSARLWRGQVLVDWQPDLQAGGCLLRIDLLRALVASGAKTSVAANEVTLEVPGRLVAALSEHHARLVHQLGGARRLALSVRLRFAEGQYVGGQETYALVAQRRASPLLQLTADVRVRAPRASQHTSPAPT
jgi:hypothetical protein